MEKGSAVELRVEGDRIGDQCGGKINRSELMGGVLSEHPRITELILMEVGEIPAFAVPPLETRCHGLENGDIEKARKQYDIKSAPGNRQV